VTKIQLSVIAWTLLVALVSGFLSYGAGQIGYAFGAMLGPVILCATIIYQGLLCSDTAASSDDYFGARSHLSSQSTLQSLGTTWIMLGNVVVANMFLGQMFGWITFWVVATWAWAFILASYRVPRIRECLKAEDTLHSFLHDVYRSRPMRLVAASITVFVGVGVFGVEMVAGAGLLVAALPQHQAQYIVPVLLILIVIAMAFGAITGGLKSIITSDSTFYHMILFSMFVLAIITFVPWLQSSTGQARPSPAWSPGLPLKDIIIFLIGVFALQVPLLLGDFGTWQRIKATKLDETESLSSLTARQALWQSFLWGVPVICGIIIATAPKIGADQAGNLYASSSPLIEIVRAWLEAASVPSFIRGFLVTVILVGFLAIMITTANSYLMISMEAFVHDFSPTSRQLIELVEASIPQDVQRARSLCVIFALVACIPVALIVQTGLSLLTIVLTVFAVQVALAPAAVLALYFPGPAEKLGRVVIGSTIFAFVAAIFLGLFATYGTSDEWWNTYGPYLAPVIALGVPTTAIVVGLAFTRRGMASAGRFLGKLLLPLK
jgi:hypothetical protein